MPSPFPGMDPFLENPGVWGDLHARLILGTSEFLSSRVRPKYLVRVEQRVYISDENDSGRSEIIPDVRIVYRPGAEPPRRPEEEGDGSRVEAAEPVVATVLIDDEIRENHLEIIDRESRQVVTVIEFLSPTNKVAGSRGQRSYLKKRREILSSPSHWVEVDLIRRGVPIRTGQALPPHNYLAHVSKVDRRPSALLWPIRLDQRLPILPVPLRPEDPDVPLDLQAVLDAAYDRAGYDLDVDYRREPSDPLGVEWAAWADRLLREKGLRPGSD